FHHGSGAPRSPATRPRKTVALRFQASGGMPRLRGKDQAWRGGVPLLRRDPRSRKSRAVRPRCAREGPQRRFCNPKQGRESAQRIREVVGGSPRRGGELSTIKKEGRPTMAALLNWTRLRSAVILSKCGQGSAVEIVGW